MVRVHTFYSGDPSSNLADIERLNEARIGAFKIKKVT